MVGLDFSEEEGARLAAEMAKQWELDENPVYWENLDEGKIKDSVDAIVKRIDEYQKLSEGRRHGDSVKKALGEKRKEVLNDLGPAGWVSSFNNTNKSSAMGNLSPTFYQGLSPEKRKSYDMVYHLKTDTNSLQATCDALFKAMSEFPLDDAVTVIQVKENLIGENYTKTLYEKVNNDVEALREFASGNGILSFPKAARFYRENKGSMDPELLNKQYVRMKVRAFEEAFGNSVLSSSITNRKGKFSPKQSVLTRMHTIDDYTYQVAIIKDLDTKMNKAMEQCKKIQSENIKWNRKECKNDVTKALIDSLERLSFTIEAMAATARETFRRFKEPATDAPYCFMKKLPALGNIGGVLDTLGFHPDTDDPMNRGTFYEEIYTEARKTLNNAYTTIVLLKK